MYMFRSNMPIVYMVYSLYDNAICNPVSISVYLLFIKIYY